MQVATRTQALEQAQGELFAAYQHTRALETERADLGQRLADVQIRAEQLEQTGAQLATRVRELEHSEQRLSEALERTGRECDQWQAQARTAEQTIARLEQAREDGERETRITTLTDLLERTQATHEAESGRWLLQIDDQRQALSAARERERRWDQERATLLSEIRRLSAESAPRPPLED